VSANMLIYSVIKQMPAHFGEQAFALNG